ncbi:MAG: GntR family transcriptional regulator [Actinomycetota bacterium]
MSASSASAPRYLILADQLEQEWSRLPPNSLVDSETQLAARFDVNRLTAREVMRELERRTVVRRIVGRGTFTALKLQYPIERGRPPSLRRLVAEVGYRHELVDASVRWHPGGRSSPRELVSQRVAAVEDLVASAATDRFVAWVGEAIEQEVRAGESIFEALQSLGVVPWRRRVTVRMGLPDHKTGAALGYVGASPPTWHVSSETVDASTGNPLHRSSSWMRGDVFDVRVELDLPPDGEPTGVSPVRSALA